MVKVFDATDKSFASNGDVVLKPLKARVRKEDNGDFSLYLETGLECLDYLTEGRIVVANTPQGDQAFRINNVTKTRVKAVTTARHAFYDTLNYLIEDTYVVDKNCNAALDQLNAATEPASPFTTISDIGSVNSFRCVRKSLYEAIQTVLERWGGHIVRDNFNIGIRQSIGADNGVTVRYKKNLQDISCEEIWDNVVTKLLPVGKDGITLPEVYVESRTQYDIPYCKTVSFEQDNISVDDYRTASGAVDETAYEAALVSDLRQQAQSYVDLHCLPEVNYTLRANIEKITDIGDTISVIDDRLGINLLTNVIAYTYDCILGEYTEIEFGNFKQGLNGLVSNIKKEIDKSVTEGTTAVRFDLTAELQEATDKIMSVLGNSYVIYDGDQILVLDKLPKEAATNVIRINSGGIGFSQTGINGVFNSAWTIDGALNMQAINVINLTADLIKGGTLKLGSKRNGSGVLELYDEANNLIGLMDKNGLKMYGTDGSYVLMNNDVGFAGYDRNGNKIYWVSEDEFHMKKGVIEEEITLCDKMRFIPITIKSNGTVINDGIGLVSTVGSN